MKHLLLYFTIALASTGGALAQAPDSAKTASNWTVKGLGGFNFAQTSMVNWSAGGDNSVATNIYFNVQANYKKDGIAWDNKLETEYGLIYTSTNGWNKSVDNLQFTSKFGYTRNDKLFYSFLTDFKTQYAKGYKEITDTDYQSNIMAPGYWNLALGIDYKPSGMFTLFYSPATGRTTFVLDDSLSTAGAFGVTPGEQLLFQFGMYTKLGMDIKLTENIQLLSTLDLFTAYDHSFGNIVIDWNTLLRMKINKYLTTTVNLSIKYDDKVKTVDKQGNVAGAKTQLKEMLGLGIAYSF